MERTPRKIAAKDALHKATVARQAAHDFTQLIQNTDKLDRHVPLLTIVTKGISIISEKLTENCKSIEEELIDLKDRIDTNQVNFRRKQIQVVENC